MVRARTKCKILKSHVLLLKKYIETGIDRGGLDDIMLQSLLNERVEFIELLFANGFLLKNFLNVEKLKVLYNEAVSKFIEINDHSIFTLILKLRFKIVLPGTQKQRAFVWIALHAWNKYKRNSFETHWQGISFKKYGIMNNKPIGIFAVSGTPYERTW